MNSKNNLRYLRLQTGISQRELAEVISIDRSMISLYENFRREIPTDTAKLLANYFNVSVDYLLGVNTTITHTMQTKESTRACINKQLDLLDVEEQNRIIGYIHGILDSKMGK